MQHRDGFICSEGYDTIIKIQLAFMSRLCLCCIFSEHFSKNKLTTIKGR